ncbi:MAG: glycoside hydrolase family 25 protein [Bacteroidales bacterium]|nr:glycoside hydrolase family 25 protein [Bacteroidales bacterium]
MAKRRKKKNSKKVFLIVLLILAILGLAGHFSFPYLKKWYNRAFSTAEKEKTSFSVYRQKFPQYNMFGIDVSEYQKEIEWEEVFDKNDIDFVFVRATAGNDYVDKNFSENWEEIRKYNVARGAYHFYRPNENSTEQANKFIETVKLEDGDFAPVLDIEKYSKVQSISSLQKGLLNWLSIVEEHYGITPILYTGYNFYIKVISGDKRFSKYPIWIARYSSDNLQGLNADWTFWQFTEDGEIDGIGTKVDINVCCSAAKFKRLRLVGKSADTVDD